MSQYEDITADAVVVRTSFKLKELVQFAVVSSDGGRVKYTRIGDDVELDHWTLLKLSVKLLSHEKTEECCPHLYVKHLGFPKGKRAWGSAAQSLRKMIAVQAGRYGLPLGNDRDRLFRKEPVILGGMTLWYAESPERPWRLTGERCSLRTLLEFAAVVVSDRFTELFDKRVWVPWLVLTPPEKFSGPFCEGEGLVEPIPGWTPPLATVERAPDRIGEAIFATTRSEKNDIVMRDVELLEDQRESVSSEEVDSSDESFDSGTTGLNVVSLLYLADSELSEIGIGLVKEGEIYKLAVITGEDLDGATTRYEGSTSSKVFFPKFSDLVEFFVTVVLGQEFSDYRIPVFPEECQRFHDWLPSIGSKPNRQQKAQRDIIVRSLQKVDREVSIGKQEPLSELLPRVGTICLKEEPPYGFVFLSRGVEENPSWNKEELAKMALLVLSDSSCRSQENHHWPILRQAVELWRRQMPEAGLGESLSPQGSSQTLEQRMDIQVADQEAAPAASEVQPESGSSMDEETSSSLPTRFEEESVELGSTLQPQPSLLVQVTEGAMEDNAWDLIRAPQVVIDDHLESVKADFISLLLKLGAQ